MTTPSGPSDADMEDYYRRFLPFRYLFQWLLHSPKVTTDFTKREIAYELRGDIYQRYQSYGSEKEFKQAVEKSNPLRFEIGAIYNVFPKDRKVLPKLALKPVAKELNFDIDLTDYDPIRTCCQDKAICKKCWKFIKVASNIIDTALRDDFGFKHILWVFLGRRGAHCWVSDARARNLDDLSRQALIAYFDVLGGEKRIKKPYHPALERAFDICKLEFDEIILHEQDPWNTKTKATPHIDANVEELLEFMPEKELRDALKAKWDKTPLSLLDKWKDINKVAAELFGKNKFKLTSVIDAKKDIILRYLYPRLDVNVSRQLNHLLKSPFCIHPATGNVCVPFDPFHSLLDEDPTDYGFDPVTSPKLAEIQQEAENNKSSSSDAWDATLLKPYVAYFGKFVTNLYKEELHDRKRSADDDAGEDDLMF